MGINYIKDRKIIHLSTKSFSYYIHINKFNHLIHLYFGEPLEDISKERCSERYMERYAMYDGEKEICQSRVVSGKPVCFKQILLSATNQ